MGSTTDCTISTRHELGLRARYLYVTQGLAVEQCWLDALMFGLVLIQQRRIPRTSELCVAEQYRPFLVLTLSEYRVGRHPQVKPQAATDSTAQPGIQQPGTRGSRCSRISAQFEITPTGIARRVSQWARQAIFQQLKYSGRGPHTTRGQSTFASVHYQHHHQICTKEATDSPVKPSRENGYHRVDPIQPCTPCARTPGM